VLKKCILLKIAEMLAIENICQNRDRRLWGLPIVKVFRRFSVERVFQHPRLISTVNSGVILKFMNVASGSDGEDLVG